MIVRPGASVEMIPFQVTGFMPPRNPPAGTSNDPPDRKTFPASPEAGTRVVQVPFAYVVEALVAAGSKVTDESGSGVTNLALFTNWPVK